MGDIIEFSRTLNLSPVNFLLLVGIIGWIRWLTQRHMIVWDWMIKEQGRQEEKENGGSYKRRREDN